MANGGAVRRSLACLAAAVLALVVSLRAQQPARSAPQDGQPGRLWPDDQIQRVARAVRAGRALTPAVWPNGARVAVVLTFTVNNSANNLARGDTAVDLLAGGQFGARRGLPRVLDVLDRRGVPATFFIAAAA